MKGATVAVQASELVALWQQERGKGRHLSPEDVCAGHPDLLSDVRRQIEALSAMESLLGVKADAREGASPARPDGAAPDAHLRDAATLPGGGPAGRAPGVPGYDILGELGRGGMGVVYKARHRALGRLVALKVIRDGEGAGPRELARFRGEAEAVAALQHPNIVQIHEVGEQGGRPFFCLEYLEGGSLAQKAGGMPQPAQEAARMVETLARAVEAAHRRGIVHRDLKPANVLLAADGTPKVADFGLARRLDADVRQTRSGEALGTPAYMAPEQAAGKGGEVGPAADVYALGVILYELLTGRPPFQAETAWDTLVQVLSHEPVPPSRLQPKVPRDLETICLSCLEKQPHRRYASALSLADDLQRFLRGEPIRARATGRFERAGKWARRHPAVAALMAAVAVVTAAGIAGVVWKWRDAEYHRGEAETNEANERTARREATRLAGRLDEELANANLNLYFTRIQLAHRAWTANELTVAEGLLAACVPAAGQPDLRGWEWHYLKRLCHGDMVTCRGQPEGLHSVSFSADGERLRGCTTAGALYEWDARTGKEMSAFALPGHSGPVNGVAFSTDGKRFATAGGRRQWTPGKGVEFEPGEVIVWESETRKALLTLPHPGAVFAVAMSPDGKFLASPFVHASKPSGVILWDAQTGQEVRRWGCGPAHCVAFGPDGRHVAVGCDTDRVHVWEAATGKPVFTARHRHPGPGRVRGVAFSPDGKRLASADLEGSARVWDIPGGTQSLLLPSGRRFALFSPDGRRLATEGPEGTLAVWDAQTGEQLAGIRGTHASAGFSPDGKRIASVAEGRSLKVWDATSPPGMRVLQVRGRPINALAFSPDGRRLATGMGTLLDVKVWEVGSGEVAFRVPARGVTGGGLAFTEDGRQLVTSAWDRKNLPKRTAGFQRWTADGGTPVPWTPDAALADGVVSPGGRTLAIRGDDLRVVDFLTGLARFTLAGCGRGEVRFSPDGALLAAVRAGGDIVVCDAKTGREVRILAGAGTAIQNVSTGKEGVGEQGIACSRDGKQLAVRSGVGKVTIWDLATGHERSTIGQVGRSFAFSRDGRRLASAVLRAVQLCDTATGREVFTLRGHRDEVTVVAFSPDGDVLASGGADATVRVWDSARIGPMLAGDR